MIVFQYIQYDDLLTYIFCIFQLDINTVAAGGGSMLFFRSGMFVVGPESAGANPGPACYQKGTVYYSYPMITF